MFKVPFTQKNVLLFSHFHWAIWVPSVNVGDQAQANLLRDQEAHFIEQGGVWI